MKTQTHHFHQAFLLLDAVMGICICATALILTFGFLYTFSPTTKLSTYDTYKQLLLSPTITSITLNTHSTPSLTYEVFEQSYTAPHNFELLRFYTPKAIR
ncbi:hypothetical protein OQH61_05360 [Helicobacter sp. MIT 21-1697]|uniref:hypothetical protein n=1 Tax=Helicobacter sp. MIT 21-1697 TaxID=2993733 RepID=UPI00224B60B8|nr:hypothetical protein [Helicobacter sp. MIT 21-1697]MCX2717161.1 hypothetical protein [Helicobacter sp. MIT 21-1697]